VSAVLKMSDLSFGSTYFNYLKYIFETSKNFKVKAVVNNGPKTPTSVKLVCHL